jgi:hypothetical protein
MSRDDCAVGVREEDDFVPAVMFQDCGNFKTHGVLGQSRMGDSSRYRQNFEDYDTDLIVFCPVFDTSSRFKVYKKVHIWVETNPYTMNE